MTKEFVPYEQAFALKELGFDEPCFGKYLSSLQNDWKEFELILEMGMNEEFEDNRNIYLLEKACAAPTFSQAFRWFRENYGLFGIILPYLITGNQWYYKITNRNNSSDLPFETGFDSYEEAEIACLKKLIEILKNK